MEKGYGPSQRLQKSNFKKNLKINEFTPLGTTSDDIISTYLAQKDVAPWFRGTSHYHIKGASKLFNALRDDGQQETTHRVKACLTLIGLKPVITSKQIKFLMRLSRGNDLVFLWFLMEKHYKTPKLNPTSYSQNEQLICSAIVHLDGETTLRELNKILPRGHASGFKRQKSPAKCQDAKKPSPPVRKNELPEKQYVLPYFNKYHLPQHYGKPLFLKRPNFIVKFKYYSSFNDPNYQIPNESNRWFADYKFSPVKRIVQTIIREIIKNIFISSKTDYVKLKTADILCGYHKKMKTILTNLKHEHKIKVRNMIFKHCSAFKENENEKRNKIKEMLEHSAQQQLRILTKKTASKQDTLKTITSDLKVFDVLLGSNECSNVGDQCKSTTTCAPLVKTRAIAGKNSKGKCFDSQGNDFLSMDIAHEGKIETEKNSSEKPKLNNNEVDAFFKCPTKHQPYKFNYQKIFANIEGSKGTDIRKMILEALDKNTSRLSIEKKQSQLLYYDAVKNCVQKIFDNEVKSYEAAKLAKTRGITSPLSQYPPFAKYDPEDFLLMDKMLFDAFQYLRKNPKFVWAQLPDAHKMPFLREWIARRFGKVYTPTDRLDSFKRSSVVYRALERNNLKVSVPNSNKIGKNFFVDYNCRNYVEKKVTSLYDCTDQDSHLLEHTRVSWFAMRGYICSNGPPRKSFYAYMPSRLPDIQHFRLWKSYEYRNQWSAWNRRQKNLT